MKYILAYISVFIYVGLSAQNITSPQIRCVSVVPNGTGGWGISISWQTPPNAAQFGSYVISTSTTLNNFSYTQQASITNYGTYNYLITTISDANTQPYFIYIYTITNSHVTLLPLDTVRTIFLSTVSNGPIAQLNWSSFANPLPAGEGTSFDVWREYPVVPSTWAKIASVSINSNGNSNYSYADTISICNDTLNYRIELTDPVLPCTSVSNVRGGRFQDKNKPSAPMIDSVSVINDQVVMGISPAYSQDVKCFVIYEYNNSTNTYLSSICNYNHPALYVNTNYNPDSASITLTALSQDSCAQEQSIFPDNRQSTIYTNVSYDFCNKKNVITWTPYQNMVTGVKDYDIYCSVNGGAPHLLGDTAGTTFYHNGLAPGTKYCYYVRAHSNGKTIAGKDTSSSTSNTFCITTKNPPLPTVAYLSNVSVNAQQTIDISWHTDSAGPVGGFNLYRSSTRNGTYNLIKNSSYTRGTPNYSYTDNDVNTNSIEYFYYTAILDSSCPHLEVLKTDTSNSIVLKAVPTANLTATLHWNSYSKYAGSVSSYNIYRSVDGVFSGNPVGSVGGGVNTYTDDLSPYADKEGIFIYYVEAVEGNNNPYVTPQKSTSNYDTVYIDANLYIPNAFVTYGANKVFLPIGAFIDDSDYKLDIYNRLGDKIYETTDPNKGWDGGGHEQGVYVYTVQYKTSIGEYRQRNGTVTLIR